MVICTYSDEMSEILSKQLKLIKKIRNRVGILYVYEFDQSVFQTYCCRNIFIKKYLKFKYY